ncbi:MAG: hypothetical protein QM601_11620 [Pseudoxanthomonas sp.]
MQTDWLTRQIEATLCDIPAMYMGLGFDTCNYLCSMANDLLRHGCAPFEVSARLLEEGFPGLHPGEVISGTCVAHLAEHWLVYHPATRLFVSVWGADPGHLQARGFSANPLYCWTG